MIHVSDISWTRKINHPSEVLKKGDEVEAAVLEIDKANQCIALGLNNSPKRGSRKRPGTRLHLGGAMTGIICLPCLR